MPTRLRVLLIEDSEDDADLVLGEIRHGGYELVAERVDTAAALAAALAERPWDLVISDHAMPQFSSTLALDLVRHSGLDVPFLIVSATIGEEVAVAAMKAGAHDYIMKGNLARLVPAIGRELREAEARRGRQRAEANTRTLLDITKHMTGTLNLDALLADVQRRAAEALPCDAVATVSLDPARKALRLVSQHGVPDSLLAPTLALTFRTDEGFAARLTEGQTLVMNDVGTPGLPAELNQFPLGALVAVPLRVRGQYFGNLCAVRGRDQPPFTAPEVALFEGIAQQVAIGIETVKLYEAREEEATVARALARLGEELSTHLRTPWLLDRLCQVTTEILGCEFSSTLLRQAEERVWIGVASSTSGPAREAWELFHVLPIPEAPISSMLEQLDREGMVQLGVEEVERLAIPAGVHIRSAGITSVVWIALRRNGVLVGMQTGYWRAGLEHLGTQREQIARGISQLASIALDNKRLIEDLESANRLKSDFMATMSHELRTPLNIIMGYNDLLLEAAFGPLAAEQADTVRRTQNSARELLDLINATLDIGRLEAGKLRFEVQEIDLGELSREIAAEATSLLERETVSVVWDVPPALPRLRTDRAKLKVVVKNLLANGVKFTDQGQVTVRAQARDGGVELYVADTGIGIAPDVLPIIFEPFRQGESAFTRRYGGVGLGLYIVRRYLDLLGGTINVESAVGRGSTFRVWLPLNTPSV